MTEERRQAPLEVQVVGVGTTRAGGSSPPGREWTEIKARFNQDPEQVLENEELLLLLLFELRKQRRNRGLTQKDVAEKMEVSQARVSAIETGLTEATEIGTLAKYVAALGGRLRLIADFGDNDLVPG